MLGAIIVSTTDLFHSSTQKLSAFSFLPLILLVVVLVAPPLMRQRQRPPGPHGQGAARGLLQVKAGLRVLHNPHRDPAATAAQLTA
jgi:hypothetical protein